MATYKKACRLCHEPFESESRNTKFCDGCKEPAKKRGYARQHRKRLYQKDAPNRRLQSLSRAQAREETIADSAIGMCVRCGHLFSVRQLETHHRDGDPFNNDPSNRVLLCKKDHAISDGEWRKAKAEGTPIPDCRKFQMSLVEDELLNCYQRRCVDAL